MTLLKPDDVSVLAEKAAGLIKLDPMPDSRAAAIHTTKGAREWRGLGWWIPIFCASCGCRGGMVPEENMTFVSWLCDTCAPKYGQIEGVQCEPDVQFWERVKLEQLEKYGRLLSEEELVKIVEEDASPLATLLKQGR